VKTRGSALLLVFAAAFLWSTGGLFIKWTTLAGLELSFWRSLFAIITVAFFTRHEGFGLNRLTALASLIYAFVLIFFVMATKTTTAANAIFLQYTAPVYLLILEPIIYKEKFRSRDVITVLVCLGAMALFFVGQLRPQDVTGNLLALASGVVFALYLLLLRHPRVLEVNRASSVIYGNTLVVLMTAPWGLATLTSITGHDLIGVSYLGVIQLGISYTLFTAGMAHGVRSLDAGIVCYIEPVLNPVWVFLILRERPAAWAILGGAIIMVTVICHMLLEEATKRHKKHIEIVSSLFVFCAFLSPYIIHVERLS
jgi:drug/metabolite transporter, DME family